MSDPAAATRELSLQEMLAGHTVQIMMARDGVTRQDVEGLIAAVRARIAGGPTTEHKTDCREFDPVAMEG